MNYSNLIQYFKSCFEIDNRNFVLNDIFKSSPFLHFEEKEELINEELPYVPIPEETYKLLESHRRIHSGEGKIYYFGFILRGQNIFQNRKVKVCAPLYFFEADIFKKEEYYYAKIIDRSPKLNRMILGDFIKNPEDKVYAENVFTELEELKNFEDIPILFDKYFEETINSECLDFPKLKSEEEIDKLYKSRAKKYQSKMEIVPAGGLCFIQDKSEIKGVLSELDFISKIDNQKSSFQDVFGEKGISNTEYKSLHVSSNLNSQQEKALKNAGNLSLSYIIGPPGTGKSYTVAAIAMDHLLHNKSVLIVSKTDEAVDVIADKLIKDYELGESILRTGRKGYQKQIQEYLKNLLRNFGVNKWSDSTTILEISKQLRLSREAQLKYEEEFTLLSEKRKELSEKYFSVEDEPGIIKRIIKEILKFRFDAKKSTYKKLNSIQAEIEKSDRLKIKMIRSELSNRRYNLAKYDRQLIKALLSSISSRTANRREVFQGQLDYDQILKTFPIWMVKMKDIYKSVPLFENLFDVVIIDEATQCDIASTIPILFRGKKAVVVGDPKQIRHISFVSGKKQIALQSKFNTDDYHHLSEDFFDYRNKSIIDLVSEKMESSDQISFLNEHFRSLPAIIEFSNKEFYANSLKIMTQVPELKPNEGLVFKQIEGIRNEKGHNIEEGEFIWSRIIEIIRKEEVLLKKHCTSIGILSPFRKQKEYLEEELLKRLSFGDIEKHQIMVGTSYSFQGNERDTMFISLSLDNDSHAMAFNYLNKPELLNVAITRARSQQYILYSFEPENISPKNRVRRYFEYYFNPEEKISELSLKDKFLEELLQTIESWVDSHWIGYNISGQKIDLLVKKEEKYLAFDLIGYPGEFEDIYSLERYKILHRVGISIFPISYIEWKENNQETVELINEFIKT